MHELAKQIGLDLPDFLGKVAKEDTKDAAPTREVDQPEPEAPAKRGKKDDGPETLEPVKK